MGNVIRGVDGDVSGGGNDSFGGGNHHHTNPHHHHYSCHDQTTTHVTTIRNLKLKMKFYILYYIFVCIKLCYHCEP